MTAFRAVDAHNNGDCSPPSCPICALDTYDCADCGRDTNPHEAASECESHHVGPCCAPCQDCRDDVAEERAIQERREVA